MNTTNYSSSTPIVLTELVKEEIIKLRIDTRDTHRNKINDFKNRIKEEEASLTELITNLDPKKEAELPQEEQDKNKKTFADEVARHKANIKALKDTLKEVRMNKYDSAFFQWTPHVGFNRQTARNFRRMKK